MLKKNMLTDRRKRRVRFRLKSSGRPRLSVFCSHRHIHAQVIDDEKGLTVVAASTLDSALRDEHNGQSGKSSAAKVGRLIAERAVAADIREVVFDRGNKRYQGVLSSFAEAAREAGLQF